VRQVASAVTLRAAQYEVAFARSFGGCAQAVAEFESVLRKLVCSQDTASGPRRCPRGRRRLGLLVATLGDMGGGVRAVRLRGGFARAWAVRAARPLLVVAGGVVFFIGMLNPALLPLAYVLSPSRGPSAYSLLQVCLTAGLFAGSAVAGRIGAGLRLPALAGAVFVFGAAILAVEFSTALAPAAVAIALSGAGNAVYAVINQTGLLEAAGDSGAHGTVMGARFAVNQVGKALGLASGAAVTAFAGARGGFAVVGAGLLAVAAIYTRHLLVKRATWRTRQDPGDLDAIAPAAREG
jgi:hypothetical protein